MIKYKIRVDNIAQTSDIIEIIREYDSTIEFETVQTTLTGKTSDSAISVEFVSELIQFSKIVEILTRCDGVKAIEYYEVNTVPLTPSEKLTAKVIATRPSSKEKLIKFREELKKKSEKVEKTPKEKSPKTTKEEVEKPKTAKKTPKTDNPNSKFTPKNPGGEAWTTSEIEKMKEMFTNGAAVKEVAEALGRSKDSVATKKRRLGLVNLNVENKPTKKTVKEETKKNAAVTPAPFTFTPEVSHTYVPETVNAWTEEELDILSNNIEESVEKLAEMIKRPIRQIERKRDRLLDGKDR